MSEMAPTQIKLHRKSRLLEIHFDDASHYELPCEYLRVFSPSAEVRAAKNRGESIVGKQSVTINRVEPVGQYAVRLVFDDGHDSGIYSWNTLIQLGENFTSNWQDYCQQLEQRQSELAGSGKKITVLFFIGLAEETGEERLELESDPEIKTVNDLIIQLRNRYDSDRLQSELLTITVNRQFAEPSQLLNAGDEIALVPRATAG